MTRVEVINGRYQPQQRICLVWVSIGPNFPDSMSAWEWLALNV
jgi:hypothetical protein